MAADPRTLLAGVLGLALGAVFLLEPGFVVRLYTGDRTGRGEYGADADSGRWTILARTLGAGLIFGGAYFLWTAVTG